MKLLLTRSYRLNWRKWRRSKGCEAHAARDIGLRDSSDGEIWAFAASRTMVIVTKDEDFAEMAGRLNEGPAILWVRCGNVLNRELLKRFEQSWPVAGQMLSDGARLVELR